MPNDKLGNAKAALASAKAFTQSVTGQPDQTDAHVAAAASTPERGAGHQLGASWASSHGNDHTGQVPSVNSLGGQIEANRDILDYNK